MRGSRLPILGLILAIVAAGAAVFVTIDPMGPAASSAAPSSSATRVPAPTPEPEPAVIEIDAAAGGPLFQADSPHQPTGDVAQSKLWLRDGVWWGLLLAEGTDEFRIHRFDWAGGRWIDTGTRVAAQASVQPDVLADGNALWVATGGAQPTPRRSIALTRFAFNPDAARYVPDPDFPVTIATERGSSLTLARDDSGRLWAAWIGEEGLMVNHTTGNQWSWGQPFTPLAPNAGADTAAVAIVSYGETVALIWSNQDVDSLFMAVPGLDDSEAWTESSLVIDGLHPEADHFSAAVLEADAGPRLFIAVDTAIDEDPNSGPGDAQVVLVTIEPDRSSRQALVAQVSDHLSRPIVLLDDENGVVYVVANSPQAGGTVSYKASSVDNVAFAAGEGAPLIQIDGLATLTGATSTKQTLRSATGFLVLASDTAAGSYAWAAGRLPGAGSPDLTEVQDPSASDDPLLFATFDPFRPGTPLDPMWETRSTGDASFAIADTADGRRVAAGTGAADGSRVRMCREIQAIADGVVRIEADVMISRVGLSDATVTAARHGDAQTAVVRFDDRGVFSFFDGATQVRSEVRYGTGVWYTSVVELDLGAQTYTGESCAHRTARRSSR